MLLGRPLLPAWCWKPLSFWMSPVRTRAEYHAVILHLLATLSEYRYIYHVIAEDYLHYHITALNTLISLDLASRCHHEVGGCCVPSFCSDAKATAASAVGVVLILPRELRIDLLSFLAADVCLLRGRKGGQCEAHEGVSKQHPPR